ncbi:MAG: sensor domain-containing diguanylate cyclase, partial [Campylobacterota bacterium]|nr:sensor domain-containing diguanylate cyclase [Campylobacterota bacterium]
MLYDFSDFFQNDNGVLLDNFLDKYTSHLNLDGSDDALLSGYYKNILDMFNKPFELEEILLLFENLAKHEVSLEYPYVIITNEIYSLKSMLIDQIILADVNSNIFEFLSLFNKINNRIANIYLNEYTN